MSYVDGFVAAVATTNRAAYTELFRMFTETHPGITVKFEAFPNEQYQTILSTALAGGKGPDVIHTKAYGGLEQLARMPMGRIGEPDTMGRLVAILASDLADMVTGTSLTADGGATKSLA